MYCKMGAGVVGFSWRKAGAGKPVAGEPAERGLSHLGDNMQNLSQTVGTAPDKYALDVRVSDPGMVSRYTTRATLLKVSRGYLSCGVPCYCYSVRLRDGREVQGQSEYGLERVYAVS